MSPKRNLTLTALATAVFFSAGSIAQQPNARDAIPENLPFNAPYGAPISLERADTAIAAAIAEATKHNWPMNIAVVDSGNNLVAFKRMNGAQLASITISQHKAHAAAGYRRETKVFEGGIQEGGLNYLLTLDGIIASRGGVPLLESGKLIGAIGCSGGTGSQDEVVCKAGAAAVGK